MWPSSPEIRARWDLGVVYDVGHNTPELERHMVDGQPMELIVHRKGATPVSPTKT